MKTLINPWFILGCLVWAAVIISRKSGHPVPFLINGYIDDAFAVPVIANISLWFMRALVIKNDYYVLSWQKVTFIVVYVSLVFEVLLPLISKRYTPDWVDALLYIIGGFFFYWVMDKPVLSKKHKAESSKHGSLS